MAAGPRFSQSGWKLAAVAAVGGVAGLVRRQRSARDPPPPPPPPPPPVTTQSSPGQIADLQQAYGADMAPQAVPPPGSGTEDADSAV
jgi:hypothetical protein